MRSHLHAESQLAAVADQYIWTEVIPAPKKMPWAFTGFLKLCREGVAASPWLGDAESVVSALLAEASAANAARNRVLHDEWMFDAGLGDGGEWRQARAGEHLAFRETRPVSLESVEQVVAQLDDVAARLMYLRSFIVNWGKGWDRFPGSRLPFDEYVALLVSRSN